MNRRRRIRATFGAGQDALRTATGEVVGTVPTEPTGDPYARERAIARSMEAQRAPIPDPPSGEEMNEAIYNATRYTGNPAQTHILPSPVADLNADNVAFAQAMVARWTDGVVLWVAAQLRLASAEVRDSVPAIRVRLVQHLGRMFAGRARVHAGVLGQAIHPTRLRDFMRLALQGAQPLNGENATAEILASATGRGPTSEPAYRAWRGNWTGNATAWMQERQALDWMIVPEIIAGLPLQPRQFPPQTKMPPPAVVADVINWYGRDSAPVFAGKLYQSLMYERNPTYRKATPKARQWPQGFGIAGATIAPDLIVYAWDGWREELSQSNRVASYALAVNLQPDTLQQLCGEYGVRPSAEARDKIIAVAESWATYSTEANHSLMMQIARDAEAQGLSSRKSLRQLEDAAITFGSGGFFQDLWNGIKRIAGHVADWFRSLGRALGKFLQVIGAEVRRWARIPIIGDFFVIATGIEFVFGTVLPQLGKVLQTGKISSFDLKELGFGVSRLLDRAGRALAIAAAFLPPPFNLAAGALAAVSILAGGVIGTLLNADDVSAKVKAYNAAQDAQFQAEVAAAKLQSEGDAARRQREAQMASDAAYDTLLDWMQREGTLGEGMLNASRTLAVGGISRFWKLVLAAGGAIAIGFAGYQLTRKA